MSIIVSYDTDGLGPDRAIANVFFDESSLDILQDLAFVRWNATVVFGVVDIVVVLFVVFVVAIVVHFLEEGGKVGEAAALI